MKQGGEKVLGNVQAFPGDRIANGADGAQPSARERKRFGLYNSVDAGDSFVSVDLSALSEQREEEAAGPYADRKAVGR